MKISLFVCGLALLAASTFAEDPALTIYNQDFAVVRDTVPLDLKAGVNEVSFANATAMLEPDSVILRDPAGKTKLQVLEQNYRNDPVSQELLLSLFEGKTIKFQVAEPNKPDYDVMGKVIRSGYVPHSDNPYQQQDSAAHQPIIEVNGELQFRLPGLPVFPSLGDDTILKPALRWKLQAAEAVKLDAELAYVTSGLSWQATYNVVAPEKGDLIDLVGWVTMDNESGKTFQDAKIKLMAGDLNRVQPPASPRFAKMAFTDAAGASPGVTEKAFDEYHLYTLQRRMTLHDRESKQVEFVRAQGVATEKVYTYEGFKRDGNFWEGLFTNMDNANLDSRLGIDANTKVDVTCEFKNTEANSLGIPLPKGRIRCYRQDEDGQLEFTGEDTIDHTPKDETIRLKLGNAFDLVGKRLRTSFHVESANRQANESFEIRLRNHKTSPVQIRVLEHLYRWTNWEISKNTDPFAKISSQEIEFRVDLKPDEEKVVGYTVTYSW